MVPMNTSTDDIEASNSNSGSGTQTRTAVGAGTGGESGTAAGSPQNDPTEDETIGNGDQPDISGGEVPENNLTTMLGTMASGLGKLEIVWMMAVLQGGFAFTLKMKDFVFIIVTLLFEGIRIFCGSPEHNMRQSVLFYWFQLGSAMITSVFSGLQLYSQDFGQTEKTVKANLDFTLNLFYVVALVEALMILAWCYLLRRPFGN